ncbi:unnamed protein product [Linum tenue]|uniref:Uncharacterized protein n=1 Tax=Linum tenue TaxID=586396 RepID=A0AAV0LDF9_9ROSI|nr:unnamed protein product [Linum tenue]
MRTKQFGCEVLKMINGTHQRTKVICCSHILETDRQASANPSWMRGAHRPGPPLRQVIQGNDIAGVRQEREVFRLQF